MKIRKSADNSRIDSRFWSAIIRRISMVGSIIIRGKFDERRSEPGSKG
ncbi:hypothetical protein RCO48_21730 [Peribacillus frigoritolerans]|nr:hypothetical protein [Peribacillus frigoritolerans]